MANFQVSKEYVRGQLVSMGIQNISEEDLEAYTRGIKHLSCRQIISKVSMVLYYFVLFCLSDFSRLVEGHLDQDDPTPNSQSETAHCQEAGPGRQSQPKTHGAPSSSAHSSSTQHTPVNTPFALRQPGSAVFKVSGFLSL